MDYRCLLHRRKLINRLVFVSILWIVLTAAVIVYYQGIHLPRDYRAALLSYRGAFWTSLRQTNQGSNVSNSVHDLQPWGNNSRPVHLPSMGNSSPEGSAVSGSNNANLETVKTKGTDSLYRAAVRPSLIAKRCGNLTKPSKQEMTLQSLRQVNPVVLKEPKIIYCPVTKAGSTFFKRLLKALEKPGPLQSPFNIPIQKARGKDMSTFIKSFKTDESRMELYGQAKKVVFTREPYARVFSAYIDKLYSPNLYYWEEWGQETVKRLGLSPQKHPCGAHVTFREFVKLLVTSLHDIHFIPMTSICQPCNVQYDIIGKMETAASDIEYLLKSLNISSDFQNAESYKMAGVLDAIDDSTFDSFQIWLRKLTECVGLETMSRIIWRKLQVRGFIYSDAAFPFTKEDVENGKLTQTSFRQACTDAAYKSSSKHRLKKQKEEAMADAYNSIDYDDLIAIQKMYKRDFRVFGYDFKPKFLFANRKPVHESRILNWNIPWDSLHSP